VTRTPNASENLTNNRPYYSSVQDSKLALINNS